MYEAINALVFDRTYDDVVRVRTLTERIMTEGWDSLTADEKTEYLGSPKGAYNAADLNRVIAAVNYYKSYIGGHVTNLGNYNEARGVAGSGDFDTPLANATWWAKITAPAAFDTDVAVSKTPMQTLVNGVKALHDVPISVPQALPPAPTISEMEHADYNMANNVEKIIYQVFWASEDHVYKQLDNAVKAYDTLLYADEIVAGGY